MKKCKNADSYKGMRKPTCNSGNPCEYCLKLYYQKTLMRNICEDIRTDNAIIIKQQGPK